MNVFGLSRETEPAGDICVLIDMDIDTDVYTSKIWSESKDLRTRSSNVQGQEKMEVPALEREQIHSPFLHLFIRIELSVDWRMLIHTGDGHLYSVC